MSWRVVVTVMIAIFTILTLSVVTVGPLHQSTGAITELDDPDDSNALDATEFVEDGTRAYGDLILIFSFGLVAYGSWYILRRELTAGRL